MRVSMTEAKVQYWTASDGIELAFHEVGQGRPVILLHGLSGKPHEAEHYPKGILARDLKELIAHLGLTEFDLGGFSLGARTTVEGVGDGLTPRRAILGGAGFEGLKHWERRKNFFLEAITMFDQRPPREDPHWLSIQFMKSQKIDRV